jgi:FixJ family two-component response regulator
MAHLSKNKKPAAQPLSQTTRARSQAARDEAVKSIRPATVLVVDDDPSVLSSLKRLLSASGFEAKAFAKPSELIASETPTSNACMVVDIDLPEMTGVAMSESLNALGRGLPTILITGRTEPRIRALAEKSDAVALLFKPFEEELLLDAIRRALASSSRGKPL